MLLRAPCYSRFRRVAIVNTRVLQHRRRYCDEKKLNKEEIEQEDPGFYDEKESNKSNKKEEVEQEDPGFYGEKKSNKPHKESADSNKAHKESVDQGNEDLKDSDVGDIMEREKGEVSIIQESGLESIRAKFPKWHPEKRRLDILEQAFREEDLEKGQQKEEGASYIDKLEQLDTETLMNLETFYSSHQLRQMARGASSAKTDSKNTKQRIKTETRNPEEIVKFTNRANAAETVSWRLTMYEDLRQNADKTGNYPIFSARARRKCWELHSADPEYWTVKRLSNVFKIRPDEMKFYMFCKGLGKKIRGQFPQYPDFGMDDRIEQLLGKEFGELDFPDTIPTVNTEDPPKVDANSYYYLSDDIRSARLKKMVSSCAKKYREAPKYARRFIPKPRKLDAILPTRAMENIYPNKKLAKFIMWDISPSKDLYNRKVLVRETDGSWRTGDWDERRFTHEARRYARWRFRVPIAIPDDDTADYWHPDEKAPPNYVPSLKDISRDSVDVDLERERLREKGWNKKSYHLPGANNWREHFGQHKVRYA